VSDNPQSLRYFRTAKEVAQTRFAPLYRWWAQRSLWMIE